jgi:hypothetical protein
MSPVHRKLENRGLPLNLHTHPKGYRYRRPYGSYCYLGTDKRKAIDAAIAANLHYAKKGEFFDKIIDDKDKTLATAITVSCQLSFPYWI